jgi:uncharacterized DUF497 family protein
MDISYELNGVVFRWDEIKAKTNIRKHDGVSFEQAAWAFFDPFFRLEDASRNDEDRDAVIGLDVKCRLLYVVHIEMQGSFIRIISARKASREERKRYDS